VLEDPLKNLDPANGTGLAADQVAQKIQDICHHLGRGRIGDVASGHECDQRSKGLATVERVSVAVADCNATEARASESSA
jgi:hypothetical protein